ncbi:hypothetical protein [Lapidilactobacillus salsurivasis]
MQSLITVVNGVAPPSIDDSLPNDVSAQPAVKTLSGWSGAWRWWSVCSSGGRSGWG